MKMEDNIIQGERIYLRPVKIEDVNEDYLRWMNDPEVTKYTESRFHPHTLESIRTYVKQMSRSNDS